MTNSLTRTAVSLCVVAGAACAIGLTAGPASAAPANLTSADLAFVTANQRSNLAEIALAKIGNAKGQDDATHEIADMTSRDHTKLKAQLSAIATKAGAAQPTAPSTMQQTVAAQLQNTGESDFDLMFASAEVTGHQMALTAARTERDTTKNAALKSYAANYVTVATPHLTMSQAEVDALGGTPTDVPAGTGGAASTSGGSGSEWGWVAGGSVLLVAAGATLAVRRRAAVR